MNQEDKKKQLTVRLYVDEDTDYLEFNLSNKVHKLNLNLEDSQAEIKKMFCDLILLLQTNSIEFRLAADEGYDNALLKEVSMSYISDLNKEIESVRTEILDRAQVDE